MTCCGRPSWADACRRRAYRRSRHCPPDGDQPQPLREAVRKLEHEGLVEYVPRRGTIVVGLSRDDVADAYPLRAHLEAYGARLAATRATPAHLVGLLELIERMRACAASGTWMDWSPPTWSSIAQRARIIQTHMLDLGETVAPLSTGAAR